MKKKSIKKKLAFKLFTIGMFGSVITANLYLDKLDVSDIFSLFESINGTKVERAQYAQALTTPDDNHFEPEEFPDSEYNAHLRNA